jgi:hypothetical protein
MAVITGKHIARIINVATNVPGIVRRVVGKESIDAMAAQNRPM